MLALLSSVTVMPALLSLSDTVTPALLSSVTVTLAVFSSVTAILALLSAEAGLAVARIPQASSRAMPAAAGRRRRVMDSPFRSTGMEYSSAENGAVEPAGGDASHFAAPQ